MEEKFINEVENVSTWNTLITCLLYTSDAADE